MNSKVAIHESESPRPAASSIMISQMTSSSVIIPYVMERGREIGGAYDEFYKQFTSEKINSPAGTRTQGLPLRSKPFNHCAIGLNTF